jgi:hypothetical protein
MLPRGPMIRKPSTGFVVRSVVTLALVAGGVLGCDPERKQQCDKFIAAMGPMQGQPVTAEVVDRVQSDVAALQLQDEPLREYAKNYKATLTVLSNTLKLKDTADPDGPPNGTSDVIKAKTKEARTDFDDISRYCAP